MSEPVPSSPSGLRAGDADYEVSAMYMASLVEALKAEGALDRLTLDDEVKALVAAPFTQRWWPALLLERLNTAALAVLTLEDLEDIAFRNIRKRFGPIVSPMVKIALTLSGAGVAGVFSRLDSSVKIAMRGFSVMYEARGDRAGTLVFAYPRPVAEHVQASWRGVIRFMYELGGAPAGRVVSFSRDDGGRTLRFELAW